jgi:predicted kinase
MIVVMAGLPGTGKSTVARTLAEAVGGVVLNKDVLRAELFPKEFVEYSTEQDDFVGDLMLRTAEYLLTRYPKLVVFLDGRTFSRAYQIQRVVETAARLETPWRIIECICPEKVAKGRIAHGKKHPAKNRTVELYLKIRDEFEPIALPKLVVDTGAKMDTSLKAALDYVGRAIGRL